MKEIFAKRRQVYYTQNLKYLRYVFNDHFMLFLVIAMSVLAVQYAQFLQHNTLNWLFRVLIVLIVSGISLIPGKIVSLLEAADSTFLLTKEEEIKKHLQESVRRSLLFPMLVILTFVLIAAPALRINILFIIFWFLLLIFIKFLLLMNKYRSFLVNGNLDFEVAINYEQNRQMSLLKIFALFTDVKGLTSRAKRRKYLDFLLPRNPKSAQEYLLWRTFFRSSDYAGMFLRLGSLVLVVSVFISNTIFATIFVTLLNYLLVFQLLALEKSQEYQPLLKIYPIHKKDFAIAVKTITIRNLSALLVIEYFLIGLFGLLHRQINLLALMAFYGASPLLFSFYINYRLKIKK
ncbi:MAG: ABC transporter permease [Streptococcaceae bacterium]|jgi:ABC-2 type transport system permease protein|nr:ABC transporter permease [Streptococcaceae bacterium]